MKPLLFIAIIGLHLTGLAQSSSEYIPSDAQFVFSLNFEQLNAKSNSLDYIQYLKPFLSDFRPSYSYNENENCQLISVTDVFNDPASFGIDLKEQVFIYKTKVKKISGMVYLFHLNWPEKFREKLVTSCSNPLSIQKIDVAVGRLYISDGISVALQNNIAVIFVKESFGYFDGENIEDNSYSSLVDSIYLIEKRFDNQRNDSLLYERLNSGRVNNYDEEIQKTLQMTDTGIIFKAKERKNAIEREKILKKFTEIQNLMESFIQVKTDHIGKNRNFGKLVSESHDAFVYTNTLAIFNQKYTNPFGLFYGYRSESEEPLAQTKAHKLTENLSSSYAIDFENGKAKIRILNAYNPDVYPYFKRAMNIKQNKKLFKYVEGENLLGYMSIAVNSLEMAKWYEDFTKEFFNSLPKSKSQQNILPAVELAYTFIDKEMLFNTLDGRAIFACTGFSDIKIKYTRYDYDDEFNKTERIEERVVKQPRMVLAASIGNEENAEKLFEIMSRFNVFTRIKENIFVFNGNSNMPFNLYFALTEDALLISNDGNLILNYPEGLPKNKRIKKVEQSDILKHNMLFKIFTDKMLTEINANYFKDEMNAIPWFSEMMKTMGSFEMSDSKPTEESYGATAVITLKDSSTNSLLQLLKMMQSRDGY